MLNNKIEHGCNYSSGLGDVVVGLEEEKLKKFVLDTWSITKKMKNIGCLKT